MTDSDDKKLDEGQTEPVYGGCEGPNAMYVKLISSDDHEFIINRDYALTSGTIKAMLSGPGKPKYDKISFKVLQAFTVILMKTFYCCNIQFNLILLTSLPQ